MDNSSAEAYGRSVGSFVGFIIVALVCLAIWRNSRRPTVNRKCAWSLYFPLAAFGTAAIVGGLFPGNRLALLVTVPFMLLTIFVSPIFAVQGLLELRKQPDRTGHGYAWWGFGLALLIAALFGAGIVKGVRKNRGLHAVRQTPLTSGRVVNTNLNFSVIPPPKPFLELDPKVLKSDASVFFRRVNPEVNSYVIAEALDVDLDSKELVEIAKVNLSAILSETSFTEPKPLTLSGIPGFLFESDGRLGFRSVKGYHWCGVENGFVYQIVTQGVADPALEKNATEFRSSFQRLDPTKRAQTGGLPIVPFKSPAFDYSIDLSQDGWQFWPSLAKDFDMAEFGAHRRQRAYLTVSPFYLYERDVPIETLADVAAGLAEVRLSSLPPEAIQRGENFVAFEFDRRVGSDAFSYRIKVIRARGSAYLLHGWWPLEEKAFRNDVLAAFESLSISPGGDLMEGKPPAEKARALRGIQLNSGQGGCYNTLGLLAFNTQDWKNAADWFALAVQYQPKERVVFENLLSALKRTGDAPAALTAIEKHEAANGSADWLRAEKAWFIAHSGNVADARAAYEKVFAGSYTDDEQFDEYVTLLLESGEAKAALAAVESYLKRRDNPPSAFFNLSSCNATTKLSKPWLSSRTSSKNSRPSRTFLFR